MTLEDVEVVGPVHISTSSMRPLRWKGNTIKDFSYEFHSERIKSNIVQGSKLRTSEQCTGQWSICVLDGWQGSEEVVSSPPKANAPHRIIKV